MPVRSLYFAIITAIVAFGSVVIVRMHRHQEHLHTRIESIESTYKSPLFARVPVTQRDIAASSWIPVQAQAKDTVVQVFSQLAEIDLLQPYKTPAQGQACGSGFFINDAGELVTNAHVVSNARSVWVQIPCLGKQIIDATIVGVCPERDLALLRISKEGFDALHRALGKIPFLSLGDSDTVFRSDELLALGYPLGQYSLKSTSGVVSGREDVGGRHYIQMSAPINPGSSGGPSLNRLGHVVGVNSGSIQGSQNANYIIPINELKIILDDMRKVKLLRKPFLGIAPVGCSQELTHYLNNPEPGGVYVVEIFEKSLLQKAGVQTGDMIYEIDGHKVDLYGDMNVPWSEDKISIADYVSRLKLGSKVTIVLYRKGARKDISVLFDLSERLPIRIIYPDYEPIEYEIIAGMVVQPLTLNHVALMASVVPGLIKYTETKEQLEPALLLTHLFPDSLVHRSRALGIGAIITQVNGKDVKTIADFRSALKAGKDESYLTFKTSNNIFVAFSLQKVLKEERRFARDYCYSISPTVKELLAHNEAPTPHNKID
jgi:serine protease Do